MVRASVLDRMSGPLCDAVLQRSGLGREARAPRADEPLPDPARRRDPAVVPVPAALPRGARSRAAAVSSPDSAETLAARASVWCEGHGDTRAPSSTPGARAIRIASPRSSSGSSCRSTTRDDWRRSIAGSRSSTTSCSSGIPLSRPPARSSTGWRDVRTRPRVGRRRRACPGRRRRRPTAARSAAWTAMLRAAMCRSGVGRDASRCRALPFGARRRERVATRPRCSSSASRTSSTVRRAAADEILVRAHAAATAANATEAAAFALAERSLLAGADGRWDTAETLVVEAREILRDAHLERLRDERARLRRECFCGRAPRQLGTGPGADLAARRAPAPDPDPSLPVARRRR